MRASDSAPAALISQYRVQLFDSGQILAGRLNSAIYWFAWRRRRRNGKRLPAEGFQACVHVADGEVGVGRIAVLEWPSDRLAI